MDRWKTEICAEETERVEAMDELKAVRRSRCPIKCGYIMAIKE